MRAQAPGAGFAAAILAGGEGSRLEMDKASLKLGGRTVVELLVRLLSPLFDEILLIVKSNNSPLGSHLRKEVRIASDILPGKGPLGGIYTALEKSSRPFCFVMGCDMPFPSRELIEHMMGRASGHKAVVPRRGEYIEPLFAFYSRELKDEIRDFLKRGGLKIHAFLDGVEVLYIDREELEKYDPAGLSFFNINTPSDLEEARRLIAQLPEQP